VAVLAAASSERFMTKNADKKTTNAETLTTSADCLHFSAI
jgi:hypothetical protein